MLVVDQRDGTILHRPPDAGKLEERMEQLLAFTNAKQNTDFVHPWSRPLFFTNDWDTNILS